MAQTETPTITGETQIVRVCAIDGGLFHDKLTKINAKLAKQGLGVCKVLSCKATKIEVRYDGEDIAVDGYEYTVQIPFAAKRIEGYRLIGTLEDLGAGQKLISAIVTGVDNAPKFPQEARLNELSNLYMTLPELTREDEREYRALQRAWETFNFTVLHPIWEAAKLENAAKVETLRAADMGCIHCNTKRARKSVLVFERDDKTLAMVGRMCAKEYFGVDLHSALCCANDLRDASYGAPRSFSAAGYRRDFGIVYWMIKNYGYVSPKVELSYTERSEFVPVGLAMHIQKSTKTMCYEIVRNCYDFSTMTPEDLLRATDPSKEVRDALTVEVLNALEASPKQEAHSFTPTPEQSRWNSLQGAMLLDKAGWDFTTITSADHYAVAYLRFLAAQGEEVSQALTDSTNYWMNVETTESFMLNCRAVAIAQANKSIGMIGMVVLKWMEATQDVVKGTYFKPAHTRLFPAAPADAYLAPMGSGMMDFEMTLMRKQSGEGSFGPWYLMSGRTPENLEVSFFGSASLFQAKEGESMKLRGKVKEHKTFGENKSTLMFHVKER